MLDLENEAENETENKPLVVHTIEPFAEICLARFGS